MEVLLLLLILLLLLLLLLSPSLLLLVFTSTDLSSISGPRMMRARKPLGYASGPSASLAQHSIP